MITTTMMMICLNNLSFFVALYGEHATNNLCKEPCRTNELIGHTCV